MKETEIQSINHLKNYLKWLVTPQDDNEAKIFKENDLIDTYIEIINKIPEMSKRELIDEINHQLSPYKLHIDESETA